MKYWGYFRSSSSYRCRIAFGLKGVAPEFVPVHLRNGAQKSTDFAAVNPQQLLPAMETDAGDVLIQSLAILEWLDETIPHPPLLPADPLARAQVRGFAQVIACEIHPLQNLRVLAYLRGPLAQSDAAVQAWIARWITDGLTTCEALLARRPATRFAFGDTPGIADICLIPQVFSAQRFGVDISYLPRVNAVYDECQTIPAFAAAHPRRQPDWEE
jgi:maleylpyruvate isomerase